VVKPIVRREEGQLSGPMKEQLANTAIGKTTTPERVPEGFQVIAVCGKSAIAGQSRAGEDVRAELTNERGQLLARRYLRDLRSDAVIEFK
jgi:peptidyl-prolyl cis-trans isomerase SurA